MLRASLLSAENQIPTTAAVYAVLAVRAAPAVPAAPQLLKYSLLLCSGKFLPISVYYSRDLNS